jgi:peptide/nickel transport system substrate-binding protein
MHGGGIELKKLFAGLLLLLLAAGAISGGCRPAEEGEVAPEPEQALIVAIGAEPENLDPLKMMSSPAATVSQHMVETLIYLDVDGALQPRLAESWEPSADGLAWDLKLREGVQFHDGTPFNAEAVKLNLDRFIGVDDPDQAAVFAFLLGEVREVEVVDDYLVRIHLNQQFAPIASHLSHAFIGMLSPASLEALAADQFVEAPVGTGPFVFSAWNRGQDIVMT